MSRRDELNELGIHTRFATIDPQWIVADHRHYQRPLDEKRMTEMLERSKDELAEKKPLVALRSDSSYWVIDGQHHVAAAQRKGWDLIEVLVVPSSGWQHEARLFNLIQHAQRKGNL